MKFQKLQDLREDSDLTQRQLSEILHLSSRAYGHYETGARDVPVEVMIRVADYYNTSLDYLLDRTKDKEKYPDPGSADTRPQE